MKKKLLIPALTLTILAGTVYGANAVSANMGWHGDSDMVQRISDRFGLNQDEVQEVFAEMHDERQLERQMEFEEKIDGALANGEITQAQYQAILEKHAEMMAEQQNKNREDFQNMSQEERQAFMEDRHAEMDSWAEENGIDLGEFFGRGEGEGRGERGGHMRMGGK